MKTISVVIPVYNEKDNIPPLLNELAQVLDQLNRDYEIGDYEIICVDDGSQDGSLQVLHDSAKRDRRLRIIEFRRNFGQTAAIAAGVAHAHGDVIVTMDGDGQNDPRDIPRLLEKLEEGYDVASGWRSHRTGSWLKRRLPSKLANGLISWLTGVKLHDYGCTLKAYRRDVLKDVKLYGEMHRFIPACASWVGAKITELEVSDHPRKHGQTKYGLSRTISVILDLITIVFLQRYSTKPIRLFGGAGLILLGVGFVAGLFVLYRKLFLGGVWISPLILVSFLFTLVGAMFILMGLIAEIIVRTYHESQGKPIYSIRSLINFDQ